MQICPHILDDHNESPSSVIKDETNWLCSKPGIAAPSFANFNQDLELLNTHIKLLGEPFFPKVLPNFGAKRQKIPEQPFFQSVAVGYLQDNLQMIFSNNLHFSKSVQCEFSWNGMESS